MCSSQHFCVLSFLLIGFICLAQCLPLDDTLRNGLLEDDASYLHSAAYTALSSGPSVRDIPVTYLGIQQELQAPELTNPPRMPSCLGSTKVSKALAAAINSKYAGQLAANATVDTTYVQVDRKCDYSSFITLQGPQEIRKALVDAATANQLCDLLPTYCSSLNIVPAPPPTVAAAQKANAISSSSSSTGSSTSTGTSTSSRSSSGGAGTSSSTGPSTGSSSTRTSTGGSSGSSSESLQSASTSPIDNPQHSRGLHRRRSNSPSKDPYVLQSSGGTLEPELPPVLEFKCVKHNFTQVLDHFPDGDGSAGAPARQLLLQQQQHRQRQQAPRQHSQQQTPQQNSQQEQPLGEAAAAAEVSKHRDTFTQVYWVCDAAWPSDDARKQKDSGNVIVFLGNESPLGIPKQPIVFENARRLNALVVLVEHRYYGESLPYPEPENATVPTEDYRWLTIEQVIADTASVVQHVREERGVPQSAPNIVIGGSYGGMIASYHRVVLPEVFDAAVAASAPIYYIVDTKMWHHTSTRYHQFIEDSMDTMSGSKACSRTVRQALEDLLDLGKDGAGRQQVLTDMHLCGNATSALPHYGAVLGLQNDIIGTFQGLAQVNNQPPVMGEMATACGVINSGAAAGQAPLAAVGTMLSYMYNSSGAGGWCYNFTFNPDFSILPNAATGYNSYTYQCCAQATVYSSELPARGHDGTLNPHKIPVTVQEIEDNCRNIFGQDVPDLEGPLFAVHIMPLVRKYGNIVFTNGDLDGWAGGSVGLLPSVDQDGKAPSAGSQHTLADGWFDFGDKFGGLSSHRDNVAFVVYRNASHCTDTHTNTWRDPVEPAEWRKQRALAMDYAVSFARGSRRDAQM